MSNTVQELKQLIQVKFDIEPSAIDEQAAFSDYDIDSLTLAELLFAIDDEYHVTIPDSAFGTITTLAQLAALVDELRAAASQSVAG